MKSNLCHQCSFDELLEEQFDFSLAPEKWRVHEVFGIEVPTSNFLHRGASKMSLLVGEAVFFDFLVESGAVNAQNPGDMGEVAAFAGQELGDILALQFLQG